MIHAQNLAEAGYNDTTRMHAKKMWETPRLESMNLAMTETGPNTTEDGMIGS